jgi:hypothetical protein
LHEKGKARLEAFVPPAPRPYGLSLAWTMRMRPVGCRPRASARRRSAVAVEEELEAPEEEEEEAPLAEEDS